MHPGPQLCAKWRATIRCSPLRSIELLSLVTSRNYGSPPLGNPQIAKAYGDAPVQAYIAAMPGSKAASRAASDPCPAAD